MEKAYAFWKDISQDYKKGCEPGYVENLANDYVKALRISGRFSWIGLTELTDDRFVYWYLIENILPHTISDPSKTEYVLLGDRLTEALKANGITAIPYYVDGAKYTPDDVKRDLKNRDIEIETEEYLK